MRLRVDLCTLFTVLAVSCAREGTDMMAMAWAHTLGVAMLAWCVGVALQLQQTVLWSWSAYGLCLALAWAGGWGLCRWGRSGLWHRVAWALVWLVASWGLTGWHALGRSAAMDPALEGQDLDVVGLVQAMPQRQELGWRFRFQIEQAWHTDTSGVVQAVPLGARLPAQVMLGWYGQEGVHDSGWSASPRLDALRAGERWRFRVRLKAAHGHVNPRGFDHELWLWEQGIRTAGYVRERPKDPPPTRLAMTGWHPIEGWRQSVRDRLLAHVSPPGVPGQASEWGDAAKRAGVVAALVTGDQAAIERSDWDMFRATGVSHLMSISGLHVTMFAWLASGLVAWVWRSSAVWGFTGPLHWPAVHVGAVAGLALAGFYALFSGGGVPAQRTWLMLLVVVVLRISARHWPRWLVWLGAAAVVLLFDPWAMLQPGFWLSFVAVGVLMASGVGHDGPWEDPVAPHHAQSTKLAHFSQLHQNRVQWLPNWGVFAVARLGVLLREQATVTLALAPLTLLFFGQVSVVGLLANLVAIPWVTLVVTPLAMLGVLWSGAWDAAVWALQPLAALLGAMATWPLASVSSAQPPWGLALLALLGTGGLVLRTPLSWKLWCLPLLWPAVFWSPPRPAQGTFELLAADVGQGNAVLVRTAGHSLLYDAGPRYSAQSDAGHRVLVPLLASMGERIDTLMLSHRDSDHTGGAAAVLAMQPQAALWTSLEEEHPLHALRPNRRPCVAGQSWDWDGVHFEVLHPPAPPAAPVHAPGLAAAISPPLTDRAGAVKKPSPNALSCVLRIQARRGSALLAGDIEAAQEQALVRAGLAPVDVLLVPHHGSKTSSTPEFLRALQPSLALVQAGYRNRFGHPAPGVVARYEELNIRLVDTVHCGAARWHSATPAQLVCERERARRYWHHQVP